jgi:hypothetical protein
MGLRRGRLLTFGLCVVVWAAGEASPAWGARTARGADLDFPAGTPSWLVSATRDAAVGFGDPNPAVLDLRLGRFPIVQIRGSFICERCSVPPGHPLITGSYLTLTFDGVTHSIHDYGITTTKPGKLGPLCPGYCKDRRRVVLASAQQALDASGATVIVGDRRGTHPCMLSTHETASGFISATCGLAIVFGQHQVTVTLTEIWPAADPSSAPLSHVWRVTETPDGWVTKIAASGDPPPQ